MSTVLPSGTISCLDDRWLALRIMKLEPINQPIQQLEKHHLLAAGYADDEQLPVLLEAAADYARRGIHGKKYLLKLLARDFGEPVPGLQIALRADDLFSRLRWKNLATDANVLNSQVTSRAADGSLDYAALLRGRKTLATRNERIGAHWQAKMSWQLSSLGKYPGAMTLRADDQAGIRQYWLGWENSPANKASMRWVLELEPQLHALSAGWSWGNWRAALATDGKGKNTEYRRVSVSWGVGL